MPSGPTGPGTGAGSRSAITAPPSASTHRYGRPIYGAFRGRRASPASPSRSPPAATRRRPGRSSSTSPAFLLAGPGPIVRGLRTSSVQDRGHPHEEHVFLWFLAVDPPTSAAASAAPCSQRVFEDAEAPVYLDTANPANVPYYASFGFEEIGRAPLPSGATMWFMRAL